MNPNTSLITVGTSIAPARNLENQQQALNSWHKLGFNILSVNIPEEINQLQAFFPQVQFVPATRSALAQFGRPYIYFDDLLLALEQADSQFIGIINSDIHLSHSQLPEIITKHAVNSLLFGSRVDVPSLEQVDSGTWFNGFDFFFFNTTIPQLFPKEDFCLGLPWWDYWMVLIPLAYGLPIKRIRSPLAFHVFHETQYNHTSWIPLGHTLAKYFTPSFPLTYETMGVYNSIMFYYLDTSARIENLLIEKGD